MDLDLRKVRYFVAVAEHTSFLRAAEALHIAQPVLSRQIRALESELKVTLFDRDTRGTRLTAAGEAMLEEAHSLLAAAEAAQRRVRDAAAGSRRFTVGFTPGVSITPAVREFSARHADVSVQVLRMDFLYRADSVRAGQVDVGYLRLPVDTHGLTIEPLLTEPQVIALPSGHKLAQRETVRLDDLGAERMLLEDVELPALAHAASKSCLSTSPRAAEWWWSRSRPPCTSLAQTSTTSSSRTWLRPRSVWRGGVRAVTLSSGSTWTSPIGHERYPPPEGARWHRFGLPD